jgi:2-(1,2-epoxy-1,2-dihydrophenyl)acetyl-CoA isomerase
MSYETILTNEDNGILTITLNRPEKLNAWTYQMSADMTTAITAANDNDDIIAIVVTGAGRGFCAGADIEAVFKAQSENRSTARQGARTGDWVEFVRGSKPIVAAINGAAIGVGLTQVLPMDMLIAARGAKLSVRFIKMGLVPELASSHFLALRCGFGAASELMLTGKTISADEAKGNRPGRQSRGAGRSVESSQRFGARDGRKPAGRIADGEATVDAERG